MAWNLVQTQNNQSLLHAMQSLCFWLLRANFSQKSERSSLWCRDVNCKSLPFERKPRQDHSLHVVDPGLHDRLLRRSSEQTCALVVGNCISTPQMNDNIGERKFRIQHGVDFHIYNTNVTVKEWTYKLRYLTWGVCEECDTHSPRWVDGVLGRLLAAIACCCHGTPATHDISAAWCPLSSHLWGYQFESAAPHCVSGMWAYPRHISKLGVAWESGFIYFNFFGNLRLTA